MPITLTCQVSYQYKTEPDIDAITNPLERAKAFLKVVRWICEYTAENQTVGSVTAKASVPNFDGKAPDQGALFRLAVRRSERRITSRWYWCERPRSSSRRQTFGGSSWCFRPPSAWNSGN